MTDIGQEIDLPPDIADLLFLILYSVRLELGVTTEAISGQVLSHICISVYSQFIFAFEGMTNIFEEFLHISCRKYAWSTWYFLKKGDRNEFFIIIFFFNSL